MQKSTPIRTDEAVFLDIFSTMMSSKDTFSFSKLSKIRNLCFSEHIIRGLSKTLDFFKPNNVCSKRLYFELNGSLRNCFGRFVVDKGHNLSPTPPDNIIGVIFFTI